MRILTWQLYIAGEMYLVGILKWQVHTAGEGKYLVGILTWQVHIAGEMYLLIGNFKMTSAYSWWEAVPYLLCGNLTWQVHIAGEGNYLLGGNFKMTNTYCWWGEWCLFERISWNFPFQEFLFHFGKGCEGFCCLLVQGFSTLHKVVCCK